MTVDQMHQRACDCDPIRECFRSFDRIAQSGISSRTLQAKRQWRCREFSASDPQCLYIDHSAAEAVRPYLVGLRSKTSLGGGPKVQAFRTFSEGLDWPVRTK
jgi:hypothetical protein